MGTKVVLIGGFHEIIELCHECSIEIVGIIDNFMEGDYYGIPIIGKDIDATKLFNEYGCYPLIICPDSPLIRKDLVDYYKEIGYSFYTLISPSARISCSATIGEGTIIQSSVNVSSESHIGRFCKLNTMCNIMHDNIISDFTTIAPNAVLLGRVSIEPCSYIGANSTILPDISISEGAVVGAGAVVTHNVDKGKTVKGVPAK